MKKASLLVSVAALACLAPAAALASADDFIGRFCANGNCVNPTITRQQMRPTWDALTATGTAQFVGGSIDGIRLTPATMVAGAMTVGVPAFDTLLRTGQVPFAGSDARAATMSAMTGVQNVDINSTVGMPTTGSAASGARDAASTINSLAAVVSGPNADLPNAQSNNGCDSQLERMQIASAANFVNNRATLAGSDAGFTRKDGMGASQSATNEIGNGGRPMSAGFTGMNCLGNLFNFSNLDILFKPPLMNNMMSQLGSMRCGPAISGISSILNPVSSSFFQTNGMGGFLPGMNLSQFAGQLNGAAQGNFTGIASLAMSLGGGSSTVQPNTNIRTMGSLYGGTGVH
ncbi:hypothetical protein ACVIGB_000056 [Bradyrhizobium sp. USDA 4341]